MLNFDLGCSSPLRRDMTRRGHHQKFQLYSPILDPFTNSYFPWTIKTTIEGDQFKVNMGEKKSITNIDIEMYLTLLGNI